MPSESLEAEKLAAGQSSEGRKASVIGDLPERMTKTRLSMPDIRRSPSNRQLEMNLLKAQLEYCFSDEALAKDNYLLSRMLDHPDSSLYGYVPVSVLAGVQRIRSIDDDPHAIRKAVRESDFLELDEEKDMVHRPGYVPPRDFRFNRDLRRTVFLFGFPCSYTKDHVKRLVDVYGTVKRIHWYDPVKGDEQDDEAPDLEMSVMLMQRRLPHLRPTGQEADSQVSRSSAGEASTVDPELSARWAAEDPDVSHLRAAYVVFHSQSQANKCVQSRRSFGEIRAITKYEFQKFVKKYEQAKEAGEKFDVFPYPHNARHALSNANAADPNTARYTQGGGGGGARMNRPHGPLRRVVSETGHRRPVVDMTQGRGPPRGYSKRSNRRPPPVSVNRQRPPRVTSPRWDNGPNSMYEPMSPIHNRHPAPKILVGDTLVDEEDLQNFIQLKRKLSAHPGRQHRGSMSGPMRSPGYFSGGRPRRASDGGPRRAGGLDQTWPPRYSGNDWKGKQPSKSKPVARSPLIRSPSAAAPVTKPVERVPENQEA